MTQISFTQIKQSGRMDAEYFQPQYNNAGTKTIPLSELCESIKTGPSGSQLPASLYKKNGIPLLRPSNLNSLTTDTAEIVSIAKENIRKKKLSTYTNEDIVCSRIGDIKFGMITGQKT